MREYKNPVKIQLDLMYPRIHSLNPVKIKPENYQDWARSVLNGGRSINLPNWDILSLSECTLILHSCTFVLHSIIFTSADCVLYLLWQWAKNTWTPFVFLLLTLNSPAGSNAVSLGRFQCYMVKCNTMQCQFYIRFIWNAMPILCYICNAFVVDSASKVPILDSRPISTFQGF